MPTTYKVLGQTSAVAPSTSAATLNLVKDPSFNLYTNTTSTSPTFTATNTNNPISSTSNFWNAATTGPTSEWRFSSVTPYSITPPFGGSNSAVGFYHSGSDANVVYLNYGYLPNVAFGITTSVDITKAIPVASGTSYYVGATVYNRGTVMQYNKTVHIAWWTSAGAYISNDSTTLSLTSNSWVRTTSTAITAPARAAYATIYFTFATAYDDTNIFIDGVAFSSSATLPTTFVEPISPTTTVLTAPFDKKTNGYNVDNTFEAITTLSYPGALQTLYTVPAGTSTVVSSILVSDMTSPASTYRIAILPSGATLAAKHFIATDVPISGNSTDTFTLGVTLAAGDSIRVAADDAGIQFSAFGSEIS
jgi:hypothetical protein